MHPPVGEHGDSSQVGVDPGNRRLAKRIRKRHKPPLRLPLLCVRAPERRVRIVAEDTYDEPRALGDGQLADERAVAAPHGLREREDDVLSGSEGQKVRASVAPGGIQVLSQWRRRTYCRVTWLARGSL